MAAAVGCQERGKGVAEARISCRWRRRDADGALRAERENPARSVTLLG
jgi:hypothetical protein